MGNKKNRVMRVALVCIGKNEDSYIEEWVAYNNKIGFDHIFIYENNWRCNLDLPNVTKIPFDGEVMQVLAYNNFIKNYKDEYDYAAFFDCDEFLYLKKHNNIQEFLTEYDNEYGVGINWLMVGSDGKLDKPKENGVIKHYFGRDSKINIHIKSIINLKHDVYMVSPHNSNRGFFDTNGKYLNSPFNHHGNLDVAILYHYYLKSYEEWKMKCDRGRSDCNFKRLYNEWYETSNNDVIDYSVYNFMYGKIV